MKKNQKWIERAKETYHFHKTKKLVDSEWDTRKTAKTLRRSHGSVCQDLMIARWLKTHSNQIERFDYMYEALEFIRKKEKEAELSDIE